MCDNKIALYARSIVQNPETTGAQLSQIPEQLHQKILNHIYWPETSEQPSPEKTTLDIITGQLNDQFQKTGEAPIICLPWGLAYLSKYPEMMSDWMKYVRFEAPDLGIIRAIMVSPVATFEQESLMPFQHLFSMYSDRSYKLEVLRKLHLGFIEANIEKLAQRPELVRVLEARLESPSSYKHGSYTPYMQQLARCLLTIQTRELETLKQRLEMPTNKEGALALFEHWKSSILSKQQYESSSWISSRPSEPDYINEWGKGQRKHLAELRAMALNSEIIGAQACWDTVDQPTIDRLENVGISFLDNDYFEECNKEIEDILKFVKHSDQKIYIDNWLDQLSEKELVIIATRVVPDVAEYIVRKAHLSTQALAEIGRHHPQLIIPMLEQGDFQTTDAVPALVRFASAFEPLAQAVFEGQYNQYLTPSWKGKLSAPYPKLAEHLWQHFIENTEQSAQPVAPLTLEWREALAHISQHTSIAKAMLKHPKTFDNIKLLTCIACSHDSLIDQRLINCVKSHPYKLAEIVKAHGMKNIEPLLDEETKSELLNGRYFDAGEYPDLMDSADSWMNLQAAMKWRDKADTVTDGSLWNAQSDDLKTNFLTRWPYLKERLPTTAQWSLQKALELLDTPDRWPGVSPDTVLNLSFQFPSVAKKICFEPEYQALAAKLTEEQQFNIYCHSEEAAHKALSKKSLTNEQICQLLRPFPKILYGHKDKLRQCSKEQIAFVFSGPKHTDKAEDLIHISDYEEFHSRLEGNEWFQIARQHECAANWLLEPEQKEIWDKLTSEHIYQLTQQHQPVLLGLLNKKTADFAFTSWTPEQWLELCQCHPRCFSIIYKKMQTQSIDYQAAIAPVNLLRFRENTTLWGQILNSINDSDRQCLLQQPYDLAPAQHQMATEIKHQADFYPFHHPLYPEMPQTGCCSGYAQDFMQYARKGKTPSSYVRKRHSRRIKPYSSLPFRVRYFQEAQHSLLKETVRPDSTNKTGLNLSRCLSILDKEKLVYLKSANHANAMAMHNKDLHYFDPNTGVWCWRDFEPEKHLEQVKRTVEDTLLKTGDGSLQLEACTELTEPLFPKKRKAPFDPEWISKRGRGL